jgi:predicted nucleic acid-binding Zn ribbon protein
MGYKYINGRYAHRVVYEQHFGLIPKGWIVHHKDEDKSNNSPENLEAMSRGCHQRLHATGKTNSEAQRMAASISIISRRKPKDATCIKCNGVFTSFTIGKNGKFCSGTCREQWRANRFIPEARKCIVCESAYMAVKVFQRYCSKSCNAKSTVRTYRTQATGGHVRRTLAEYDNIQPDS